MAVQDTTECVRPKVAGSFYVCFCSMVLLGLAAPVCHGGDMQYARINGKRYVSLRDLASYYGLNYRQPSAERASLRSRWSELHFEANKKRAVLNDVVFHLCWAPADSTDGLMISRSDWHLSLAPLLRPAALRQKTVRRIVIDPGHGGKDSGATRQPYKEKQIVLEIALKTAKLLQRHRYQVALTRTADRFVPLQQRAARANRWKADLFISIHANAASDNSVAGVETFSLAPQGTPSTYDTDPRNRNYNGNGFNRENTRLAYLIQKHVIKNTRAHDRGVKHARFSVLRSVKSPAVLLETGFLSNNAEAKSLSRPSYQRKLARAIAAGVIHYHRSLNHKEYAEK